MAPHSSTGEPRRRGKTVVDVAVDTQQSLEGGEKMLKTIEVCFINIYLVLIRLVLV